jgi:hypothetical protein
LQISPDVRLDLPQVAVVGSQSSGKSSVLEALVSLPIFLNKTSVYVAHKNLKIHLSDISFLNNYRSVEIFCLEVPTLSPAALSSFN